MMVQIVQQVTTTNLTNQFQQTKFITSSTVRHFSLDFKDDLSGYQNLSH